MDQSLRNNVCSHIRHLLPPVLQCRSYLFSDKNFIYPKENSFVIRQYESIKL